MAESSRKNYKKALSSLRFFIEGFENPPSATKFAAEWVVRMFAAGLSPKSRLHYFEAVAALYASAAKEGLTAATDEFDRLRPAMKAIARSNSAEVSASDLENLHRLTRSFFASRKNCDPAQGLIAVSMMNGALSPIKIARLRTDELTELEPESREAAACMAAAGRKYLFPLDQSRLTPRQLERSVASAVAATLGAASVRLSVSVQETLGACWALAALNCGASGAEVAGTLGFTPEAMPVLGLVEADASAEKKSNLRRAVSSMFQTNPKEWFALRLRPHVRFERFESRLGKLADRERPDIFYPCREISRRVNKKIVTEQKPVIPEIVFFRSRVTDVAPLIHEIGDLGWVYTSSGTYARIAPQAMEAFQRAIGLFAPGFEVGRVGTLEFHPGDRVEILGGFGQGHSAEVIETKAERVGGVIYRLRIFGDQRDIEFRVADPRMLKPQRLKNEINKTLDTL